MNLDISRLRRSDRIVGASAIALFIFLFFFKWYGGSAGSSAGGLNVSNSYSGWHTFTNSRWIWLITIVVALGSVAIAAGALKFKSPVQLGVLVAGLGALTTLLIFYRIVHHPSGGSSGTVAGVSYSYSYGIKIGIWLGLIAAVALTYGGYLTMGDEGTSLADVREQASATIGNFNAGQSSTETSTGATTTTIATPIPTPPATTEPEQTPPEAPPAP